MAEKRIRGVRLTREERLEVRRLISKVKKRSVFPSPVWSATKL
jgi:hypothetical protein